ncbi:MAG: sodium-independent anion transporter, partial [Sulfurospirillum sp.]|nr:sodium-independent anion transporter [Sulfurospirillum sp.]
YTFGFKEIIRQLPEVEMVVFRMEKVPHIDQSGMYAIDDAIDELVKKKVEVAIVGIQTQPEDMLRKIQLIPSSVPEKSVYKEFEDLIDDLHKRYKNGEENGE